MKKIVALFFLILFLTGCPKDELSPWAIETEAKRTAALLAIGSRTLSTADHIAVKGYFDNIVRASLRLKSGEDARAFQSGIERLGGARKVAARVLIDKQQWELFLERCQRGRFFICAEEVRAYETAVNAFVRYLTPAQGKEFEFYVSR